MLNYAIECNAMSREIVGYIMGDTASHSDSPDVLRAEIERLRSQLNKRAFKYPDVEFLGRTIPGEVVSELAAGRKLPANCVLKAKPGMRGDGGGLWLRVSAESRSWFYRYQLNGRGREMGLGSTTDVTLAQARGRAAICRRLVREGVDVIELKRSMTAKSAAAAKRVVLFKDAANTYIKDHRAGWRNPKHADQWAATIRDYVTPVLGDISVADVDTALVLKCIKPIWATKTETAARVRGRIELILNWAAAAGYRSGENPARWRGHLDQLLPARSNVQKVKPFTALPWRDMGAFYAALCAKDSVSAYCLRFTILTASRTSQAIGARWSEIDFPHKVWVIPEERMKAKRQHRVPLSDEAMSILNTMAELKAPGEDWVFPGGKPGQCLSNAAMSEAVKDMPFGKITVHGFRSCFKDWAAESTAYPFELSEMAMAHAIKDKTEAAYRRGDLLEKRAQLMTDWAKFCLTPRVEGANVVAIRQAG
jgi:integrase